MKKIGLIDVDGHNFPNLALMKISSWHKLQGDKVEFLKSPLKKYDIIYLSKIFSYTQNIKHKILAEKIIKGGTGYNFLNLHESIDKMCPDYDLYNCIHAYGFLTRGCIRNCNWCIVPKKEGKIKPYMDIEDFLKDKKSAILMDNNVLAHEHGIKQIEKIIKKNIKVDFNQGLDVRLIDNSIAKLLSKVKWITYIRMSCDTLSQFNNIKNKIKLLNNNGIKNYKIFIYVLIQNIDESLGIINYFKTIKVIPFAQPFRDFNNNDIDINLKRFSRWVNHKAVFYSTSWENYKNNFKGIS